MRVIDYFDRGAALDPSRSLLRSGEQSVSYGEGLDRSWALAAALAATGLRVGDRVGVLSPNEPDAFLAMLGIWRAGCSWVPLNTLSTLEATLAYARQVGCRALFVHSGYASRIDEIRAGLPDLQALVALDRPMTGATPPEAFLAAGAGHAVADWDDPHGRPDAEACAWPTGGTTGRSKAVCWTNGVWATLIETATRHWPAAASPVNLLVAPITHAAGVMGLIFTSLGATIVMRTGFDADDVLDRIAAERVTHLFLPPTAYYALLERQRAAPRDCSSLTMLLLSASPVSPERLAEGVTAFGPCLAQAWGQAEAPFMLTFLTCEEIAAAARGENAQRLRSCGQATFSTQVASMDDDGRLVGAGERGELVVRGRIVTPGYLDEDAATAAVREHGWHHTGDVGYLDEDGYVYIVDRKKDMVITGGFNVYPAEVEAAMHAMPGVRRCAVIGLPDEKWGEAVFAVVVPTDPAATDAEALIAAARAALGPIKTPKAVAFVDQLPQTAVGKVDKRALRARRWETAG